MDSNKKTMSDESNYQNTVVCCAGRIWHPSRAQAMGGFLVSLLFAFVIFPACTDVQHYQLRHDADSLYKVLAAKVSNGDPLAEVQKLLGPGQVPGPQEDARILAAVKSFVKMNPNGYPDGIQDTDTFVQYPLGKNSSISLQFRDGKLVNHIPDDYQAGPGGALL